MNRNILIALYFILLSNLLNDKIIGQSYGSDISYSSDSYTKVRSELYREVNNLANTDSAAYLKQIKKIKRWEWFWAPRIDAKSGSFSKTNEILRTETVKLLKNTEQNLVEDVTWTELGPFGSTILRDTSYGSAGAGRTECIWVHPNDTRIIYIGSNSSGLWKTTNGGVNWECLTDAYGIAGVLDIEVDVNNPNLIYISSGIEMAPATTFYSAGIWKSTDGGQSWTQIDLGLGFENGYKANLICEEILIDPNNSNILYVLTHTTVYKSTDGGINWVDTKVGSSRPTQFKEMEFMPNDPNSIVIAGFRGFFISENGGNTWNEIDIGVDTANRIGFSTTPSEPNSLYVMYNFLSSTKKKYFIKSQNRGGSWLPPLGSCTLYGNHNFEIEVSHNNPNIIYIAGLTMEKSINMAKSFYSITEARNHEHQQYMHVDVRELFLLDDSPNDILYACNDGGLELTTNGGSTWQDISGDLRIMQFYGLANTESDPDYFVGGAQDCGTSIFIDGDWIYYLGGDGGQSVIDYTNKDRVYVSLNQFLYRIDVNANNRDELKNFGKNGQFNFPIAMDPINPDIIFVADDELFKSVDGGTNLIQKTHYGNEQKIRAIEICESNPNYVYFGRGGYTLGATPVGKLYKSIDKGEHWQDISENLSGCKWGSITDIEVHPYNPDILWISFGNFSSGRVYQSKDGGNTWSNISLGLQNFPVMCIEYDPNGDCLYIGTDFGVYFKKLYCRHKWTYYGNFPKVMVTDIKINKTSQELIASTFGRGVWKTSLYCKDRWDIDLYFSDTYTNRSVFTTKSIFSSGTEGNSLYIAENIIELNQGFETMDNMHFIAEILPCIEQSGINTKGNNQSLSFQKSINNQNELKEQEAFMIYPNPNEGEFVIKPDIELEDYYSIEVYNYQGKIVYQVSHLNNEVQLDLSEKPKGIYFIRINYSNEYYLKKVVIN